ncbi:GerAB/ArcD/ProY family transporter [Caproiciproducens sp. CPB-2]|uniref:GerAB/ArcD/ProY family transporter n=1 Tax=Caproiciproducens sp. CPB-2 TaxID=3030017 RepID=UPI0023DB00E1|nr:endospore germination permease [Caproiciproducens sp. CPB-2]MDF1493878.1 endospore germination permease [Caproiciproducens sp. CPB-2]
MKKQYLSVRQAICILIVFICGSSVVLGGNSESGQDSWIALLLSQVIAIPTVLVYAKIIKLFPEKNIFEAVEILFGKIAGKIVTVLISWYALHLGAMVLRNFSEFVEITSMPETPQLALMMAMIVVVVYMAKSGVQILGKWSLISLAIIVSFMFITILLLYNRLDASNFLPVMEYSTKEILSSSYSLFSFPLAETVLFLALADSVKKEDNPFKIYVWGEVLGALIMLTVALRNISVLGATLLKAELFPSYVATRIISLSDFLARVEGFISTNFILGGITKITVCLLAASKGLSSLFNIQSCKKLIFPVGLSMLALCVILYRNTMEMINFLEFYKIYSIPFQIVIPLMIWIGGEIRARIQGKAAEKPA